MARAGYIPATQLRSIAPGVQLLTPVALAYLNLQLIAKLDTNTAVTPAGKGAGYRSWNTALEFYKAGQGNLALRDKWDIDPHLQVAIAYPPGTHGPATSIDMLFNGRSPDDGDIAFAKRYGFAHPFGSRDINHFTHDRITAVNGVRGFDKIRLTARYLNGLHLGRTTQAEHTGKRDADFIWLVQDYGHLNKTYSGPVDEKTGPHTEHAFDLLWKEIKSGK